MTPHITTHMSRMSYVTYLLIYVIYLLTCVIYLLTYLIYLLTYVTYDTREVFVSPCEL